jgi:hypothetical protein
VMERVLVLVKKELKREGSGQEESALAACQEAVKQVRCLNRECLYTVPAADPLIFSGPSPRKQSCNPRLRL